MSGKAERKRGIMQTLGSVQAKIKTFLEAEAFGVAGASDNPQKYGYKCLDCYLKNGRKAYPINPSASAVLGQTAYKNLSELPEKVLSLSIITPPVVTDKIVDQAIEAGVKNIWMQPGAESKAAIQRAEEAGLSVIHGGPCLLVELGYFS
jgi:predicted CoA-binding protein